MLEKFQTYQMAVRFHRECVSLKLPYYLKNQLLRASSSIALNLAEGSTRGTEKEKLRFYRIAFGSLRECQAALDLVQEPNARLRSSANLIGGCLYRLCHPKPA